MSDTLGFYAIAQEHPDRAVLVEPDGASHTAGQVLGSANQVLHGLRALGLGKGDVVATLLPNGAPFIEVLLAAMQGGLYMTPINWHLIGPEIAYIVNDSGAKVFIVHERFAEEAAKALTEIGLPDAALLAVGEVDGFGDYQAFKAGQPTAMPTDRVGGALMNYTSGTTGKPKGVFRPLDDVNPDEQAAAGGFLNYLFGIQPFDDNVHLTVAPMYHTAAGQFTMAALHFGHKVVLMDKWTPEDCLQQIQDHAVTTSHMVPTMFHRMLDLPDEQRLAYDVSSVRTMIHSAAPCPVATKHRMLEWWGDAVWEYYAATEGGGTIASPADWLTKPGTVGKPWPISEIKVLDDDGNELPPGDVGTVWMKMGDRRFEYHGDDEKTSRSWNERGFFTVGDAGYLDDDGWLFLSDRKADMIISGGLNIYPAETEGVLIQHPKVADCAVFGIPDDDWGEQVKGAVQLQPGLQPSDELVEELLAHCREQLARFKVPRTLDFHDELPRTATGKLLKRELRAPYWADRDTNI